MTLDGARPRRDGNPPQDTILPHICAVGQIFNLRSIWNRPPKRVESRCRTQGAPALSPSRLGWCLQTCADVWVPIVAGDGWR